MDGIRAFRREDIPEVARLWLRVFRRRAEGVSTPLQDYFREILFDGPWRDPELPSLVYEEGAMGIVGFLGVIPRTMIFEQQPIRVAVPCQLMADERARTYPATKLMRRFLAGCQDLSFADGANEQSENLWRACGGVAAGLHSLKWTRILRPARYLRVRLKERLDWKYAWLCDALQPVSWAIDTVAGWTTPGARLLPGGSRLVVEQEPADQTLHSCVERLADDRVLRPAYQRERFRWLLARAAEKRMYGSLRRAVVRAPDGGIEGWYLYYLKPGGVGQVLQLGARPKRMREVLNCLFNEALQAGAVAISGGVEPRFARELAATRCELSWPDCAVLVHSRHREILNAIHRGDAFFSRLEGEWWARFSDPAWTVDAPAADRALLQVNQIQNTPVRP